MDDFGLINFFKLENDLDKFEFATNPKSCGGGNDFKIYALYGDKILDIALIRIALDSGVTDTGQIKHEFIESFHNEITLTNLGKHLKIDSMFQSKYQDATLGKSDIKECVEALIYASFKAKKYKSTLEIIRLLFQICKDNDLLFTNPLKRLNEIDPALRSQFIIFPLFGSNNQKLYYCVFDGDVYEKKHHIRSEEWERKDLAEADCAAKLLDEIENITLYSSR